MLNISAISLTVTTSNGELVTLAHLPPKLVEFRAGCFGAGDFLDGDFVCASGCQCVCLCFEVLVEGWHAFVAESL